METHWRIRLLGGLCVEGDRRVISRFRTQKSGVLLAYLAYHLQRSHPREELIELLWPECEPHAGRNNLSKELSWLRDQIEPPGVPAGAVLIADRASVRLNPEAVTTDVASFETAFQISEQAQNPSERVQLLAHAVEQYRGELLPGYHEDWVLGPRQWLAELYVRALAELVALLEAAGDRHGAIGYARRLVSADPLREEAHHALIRLLIAAGQPGAALYQYRELERLLRQELGAAPDAATRDLVRDLERLAILRPGSGPSGLAPSEREAAEPAAKRIQRVVLLSRCHAPPEEHVVKLLEAQLVARGYSVSVDRQLAVSLEWGQELERQIRAADAVIPLLSPASVESEMLAFEVQMAHEAAQQHAGKPRVLPVGIDRPEALPDSLAGLLDPLPSLQWSDPWDDERLVTELLEALRDPGAPSPAVPLGKLEPVGGAVPIDSTFYIVRPVDGEFRAAITRRESLVLIKGARQMGKTSLLAQGLQQAQEAGAAILRTDLQKLNAAHLESAETFYLALAHWIAAQFRLDVSPAAVWKAGCGPNLNFELYLQRELLEPLPAPIVWGLDQVDRLFVCEFGSEVFALFRSWYNERSFDPTGPWSRLTLAMAYATEAHLFIADANQSPFNVGTQLTLEEFTFDQVADLNHRYGSPLRDDREIDRFYQLVNGHPFLVRRGLHEMAAHGIGIGAIEVQSAQDAGIFGDHLRRVLVMLGEHPELAEVVRGVLRGQPCPTVESFYRLRSAGVLSGPSARDVRLRCPLYAAYLERHLR
jgi:DNA-binding SARP family transcriptional activator